MPTWITMECHIWAGHENSVSGLMENLKPVEIQITQGTIVNSLHYLYFITSIRISHFVSDVSSVVMTNIWREECGGCKYLYTTQSHHHFTPAHQTLPHISDSSVY